ncbi:SRA stem-loop-interacting RNA-binding protein, mitochondrial [Pseudophryne corroboree]|uniref:SRA stem-loop-interacting RNA-binding protein, mitochondrial n=1 Tax=Pseudophryne corroboree TaxID=495146 RepID=UPI0030817E0C
MAASAHRLYQVFVARVPWVLSHRELRNYFTQFGKVTKCELIYNKKTGFHKGYGWVTFSSEEGIQNALQEDHHIVEGNKLEIKPMKKKE